MNVELEQFLIIVGYLLITSGLPLETGQKSEVYNLETGAACTGTFPPYPVKDRGLTGALMMGNTIPFLCGGHDNTDCYKFQNGQWEQAASLSGKRFHPVSIKINETTLMLGSDHNGLDLVSIDGTVENGPALPSGVDMLFHGKVGFF